MISIRIPAGSWRKSRKNFCSHGSGHGLAFARRHLSQLPAEDDAGGLQLHFVQADTELRLEGVRDVRKGFHDQVLRETVAAKTLSCLAQAALAGLGWERREFGANPLDTRGEPVEAAAAVCPAAKQRIEVCSEARTKRLLAFALLRIDAEPQARNRKIGCFHRPVGAPDQGIAARGLNRWD